MYQTIVAFGSIPWLVNPLMMVPSPNFYSRRQRTSADIDIHLDVRR